MDTMLTVEEVASILKVQPLTVRQMFREGRIRGFKIGKAWRTTMPILEEDISCMSRGVKPPRLEQAAPGDEVAPVRKRRAKPEAEPVETVALPVVPKAVPTPPLSDAPQKEPAVPEETDAGAKRKRKPASGESTEQQLLF